MYDADTGGSIISVSDFFVSSYTPSLDALLEARQRPVPPQVKVLAAIQPKPGKIWGPLPKAEEELKEITKAVPSENRIFLSDAGIQTDQPDYEGQHTTVENVVKNLPDASILHLACHGTQDLTNPLDSAFILANSQKLTIDELMKHHLPNAHIAILSACHTASNDTQQPDESVNLASALLFLGFSSILATKW